MSAGPDKFEKAKIACAEYAAGLVRSGMRIGLGTGSTAEWLVRSIGRQVRECSLQVRVVATSTRCEALARREGMDLVDLNEIGRLDLTIDGTDECDRNLDLIKGGGGALLREKIVAASSDRLVVIADESKRAVFLGGYPLPVEVTRYGWKSTGARIARCLAGSGFGEVAGVLRAGAGKPFRTDEGNLILDFQLDRIVDPAGLHVELVSIAGVVETGLFPGHCGLAIFGKNDGTLFVQDRPPAAAV